MLQSHGAINFSAYKLNMLRNRDREKLVQVIVFFAGNVDHLGKIKLFKLLYLLDFEHFRSTGRSVTGLSYRAWKFGPAPVTLFAEWDEPEPDLAAAIEVRPEQVFDYMRETLIPRTDFDGTHFTKRELRLMQEIARRYRDERSPGMIGVTHVENGAWAKVWRDGEGWDQPIPYALAVPEGAPHRAAVLEAAEEYEALARHSG